VLPLEGIRVIDFTAAGAGPCCTMLLGDFGAEVIKIEPPEGDHSRIWGTTHFGNNGEFSGLYLAVNRNKSSVVLDLKTADGQVWVRDLIASADVVVENFKPGVAARLGIGYEQARELKRDIIYCSISGFGQNGPLRDRPGFDNLIQAYVGHMSVTGEPGRASIRSGVSANDILTAAHGAFGVMVALRHRDLTGEGQTVDTSLYDTGVHLIGHYIADYTGTGHLLQKTGPYFPFLAPYGVFQAKDREFYMGCGTDKMFERFCRGADRHDLLEDPRFAKNGARVANQEALLAVLDPIFKSRTGEEWVEFCIKHDIPTSLVYNIAEVVQQEQAEAREMLIDVGVDGIKTSGIPIKLSRTPGEVRRFPPSLGADTDAVLAAVRSKRGDVEQASAAAEGRASR
jgi:crotonobetainyl-CoA:carnitine CoA-transferase CaiB-like acyl-CoA transferase